MAKRHGRKGDLRVERRKIVFVIGIILLIAGVGVFLFPTVQQFFYEGETVGLKEGFLRRTGVRLPEEEGEKDGQEMISPEVDLAYGELYALLQQKNRELYETGQQGLKDAFSYEHPDMDFSEYGLVDNCIGFIQLPTIDMELPLYLGANTANMKKGAVHLTQTSYPVGGDNTNCVIAAHRGTSLVMFRNIHLLEIGDEITILNFRESLLYEVVEIAIIKPSEIGKILIQEGRDLVTLISCNPLGANYQRYVVYCERVEQAP